jgi:catechol 2,3-dioxygenase-like lactoylglutathione lyase family enzyme
MKGKTNLIRNVKIKNHKGCLNMIRVTGINHVTLSVNDLDQSFEFYRDVLGLKPLAKRKNTSAYFLAGNDWIALVQTKERVSVSPLYSHLALTISVSHFAELSKRIVNSGAIIWQENSTPGESLYFLDPSGNKLEIHTGDWKSRINWLRENPSSEVELFLS